MKIIKFDVYKDGGTIEILTNKGNFYIDHRLKTTTDGVFYNAYPDNIDAMVRPLTNGEKTELVKALNDYPSGFYVNQVEQLIKELN